MNFTQSHLVYKKLRAILLAKECVPGTKPVNRTGVSVAGQRLMTLKTSIMRATSGNTT